MKKLIVITALMMGGFAGSAMAEGDAVKGEKFFKKKCMQCHSIGEGAKNKTGPVLTDVIGRQAGTGADYKYSKYLVEAGEAGLTWNEEEVSNFITNPKKYLRARLDNKKAKSKMSFKLKKAEDRADVIAYLKTFSK